MAEHDERDARGAALLVGAGPRVQEVGAVLAALAHVPSEGAARPPLSLLGVTDLEELLTRRGLEGLLILDPARVPSEDIGFVRRFLERHPGWRLALVGDDASEGRARALLALGRSQWIPWPPDLEQLRALLPSGGGKGSAARAERAPRRAKESSEALAQNGRVETGTAEKGGEAGGVEKSPVEKSTVEKGVEIGALLEELLARAVLEGGGNSRYQFHASATALVPRARDTLAEGLGGLVELARACAGSDGLVRAAVEGLGDAVRIGLEFPRSRLPEKDLPALFEHRAIDLDPGLEPAVMQARSGADLLRAAGGEVRLAGVAEDRVRCQVLLSARPGAARQSAGKPEDPFA